MTSEDDATVIALGAGEERRIDGALHDLTGLPPQEGRFAGRVVDGQGLPVVEARVAMVSPAGGVRLMTVVTDADGRYTSPTLEPGRYRVRVTSADHPTVFYPAAATLAGSAPVTVRSNQTTSGVDVTLPNTGDPTPPGGPGNPAEPGDPGDTGTPSDEPVVPGDEPVVPGDPGDTGTPSDEPVVPGDPLGGASSPLPPAAGAFGSLSATQPPAARVLAPPGPAPKSARPVLAGARSARVRGGRVRVRLGCAGSVPCVGTARLVHAGRTVARGPFRLATGTQAVVALRVTAYGRRVTRQRRTVTLRLLGAAPTRMTLRR